MITVTFPIPPEKVREEADRLKAEIKRLETERKVVYEILQAVYASCPHKKLRTWVGSERDGGGSSCSDCGRETSY